MARLGLRLGLARAASAVLRFFRLVDESGDRLTDELGNPLTGR